MKVVVLAEDDVIDGMPRVAGEVVTVDDSYTGPVRRTVAVDIEKRNRKEREDKIKEVKDRKERPEKPEKPEKPDAKQNGNGNQSGNGNAKRSATDNPGVAG